MEINEKSIFNEAGYQIQRLNTLWWQCNNALMSGELSRFRWALECVELELLPDAFRLEGTQLAELEEEDINNKIFKHISKINKKITANENSPSTLFQALKEKHRYLKALQETGGKGGNYEDLNADDME